MSVSDELGEGERILRSYRRARTYPKTIRKLANLDLPYPVTIPQLATWLGLFAALWYSRPLWLDVAGPVQALVLIIVPTVAAVALRHLRMEGRSPVAMLTGLVTLLYAPSNGILHGRPLSFGKPARYGAMLVFEETGTAPSSVTMPMPSEGAGR
ncbi:hypothetical protein J4573_16580 [Actinomadura barringtoniae]|uniref:Uncharacterized protein n=1 Tax=Actinomadura barringtoniae TaxID=1427535 RepID=A0A939TA61_9ACTN|nr:hypothetical protein [Actinomadura barringtoniae]MBO2448720.1 hypothetical protein [Actinomadura barringtoniae]